MNPYLLRFCFTSYNEGSKTENLQSAVLHYETCFLVGGNYICPQERANGLLPPTTEAEATGIFMYIFISSSILLY